MSSAPLISAGMAGQVATLFGLLPGGLGLGVWCARSKRTRWVDSADLDALCRHAVHLDSAGEDVYLLLNPRTPGLSVYQRGGAEHVAALVGLWADVDHADPGHAPAASGLPHPSAAAAREVIDAYAPPAGIGWHTGGGDHLVWSFAEPWMLATDEDRRKARALSMAWQEHLAEAFRRCGLHFDRTGDLARQLRPVGTHRRKVGTTCRVSLLDAPSEHFPAEGVFDAEGRIRREWRPTVTYTPSELAEAATLRLATPPPPRPPSTQRRARRHTTETDSPAEAVAAEYSWADLLEPAGWTQVHPGPPELWRRPGAQSRYSARCFEHACVVWSSAAGLPDGPGQGLSKFRLMAALRFGGDESATARAVRQWMRGGARP